MHCVLVVLEIDAPIKLRAYVREGVDCHISILLRVYFLTALRVRGFSV